MRRALISDIHGNLEALEAVLDDIKAQGISEIYCLGDIIGYGPNPRECIDLVMENCQVTLLGNHDQGAMFDPDGFNIGAERAIFWTREQLESSARPGQQRTALGVPGRAAPDPPRRLVPVRPRLAPQPAQRVRLPRGHLQPAQDGAAVPAGRAVLLPGPHARPGRLHRGLPVLRPRGDRPRIHPGRRQGDDQRRLGRPAARRRPPGLLRHPGRRRCADQRRDRSRPGEANAVPDEPGDDPGRRRGSASPATTGPIRVRYRRLAYDHETTIQKIYAIPELEPFLGDRLRQGR